MEASPITETIDLYVDGGLVGSGIQPLNVGARNLIGLGDTSSLGNSRMELLSYSFIQEAPSLPVKIDIKPGSDPNCLNINGQGVIPVAILGSMEFLVDDINIDPGTENPLQLNGLEVRVRGKKGPLCAIEFSNADEFPDLVCHFEDDVTQWELGVEPTATLTGSLIDGTPISGIDSICVVN